jgi:hypothetical protein
MGIERMALHARARGHHAKAGAGWAKACVQIDRRFDNPPARFSLLFGPALERVRARYGFRCAILCIHY